MTAKLRHLRMLWLGLGLILALATSATRAETEIIGGEPADPHQFPFIANIRLVNTADWRRALLCGGVLIAPRWVATAGHCVVGIQANRMEVVLGDHNLDTIEGTEVVRSVRRIIRHPGFSLASGAHDIALLYLDADVPIRAGIIEVAPLDFSPAAGSATIAGWGVTAPQRNRDLLSNVLRRADVAIMSDADCQNFIASGGMSPTGQICTAPVTNGVTTSTCYDDSGGPLMINNNGQWTVIGLTSFSNCAVNVAYTPTQPYADWIAAWIKVVEYGGGAVSIFCPDNCTVDSPYNEPLGVFSYTWTLQERTYWPPYVSTEYYFDSWAPCPSDSSISLELSLDGWLVGVAQQRCP